MKIIRDGDVDIDKWKSFLQFNRFASPFQTPEYFRLCNSVFGFSAHVFGLEEREELAALVLVTVQKERGLKGLFSKRGIIYGGPLLRENDTDSLKVLLKEIRKYYKKKLIYIEIRNYFDYSQFHSTYNELKWNYIPYLNIQIDLKGQSLKELIAKMKYNRRREIKMSLKEGAVYGECSNVAEVLEIYEILKALYRNTVKLPLPSYNYFKSLFESKLAKVFFVKHENRIIGGSICPWLDSKGIYTAYYCGLRKYHKNIFPTHLAVIAAIDFGIKNKLKTFDFMGAGLPDVDYGVRNYKAQFGGEIKELGRYVVILNSVLYNIGVGGLKVLKMLKK